MYTHVIWDCAGMMLTFGIEQDQPVRPCVPSAIGRGVMHLGCITTKQANDNQHKSHLRMQDMHDDGYRVVGVAI